MCKDRQNWLGRTPKKQLFTGLPSPFDWERALKKINDAKEQQLVRTTSGASDFSVVDSDCSTATPTPVKREVKKELLPENKKEVKSKFDIDWLKTCYECKVAVWVGPKDAVIDGIGLAWPSDTDWESTNAEPYCAVCWKKEDSFLEKISNGHKGKGRKDTTSSKSKAEKKKKKVSKKELAKLKQEVIKAANAAAIEGAIEAADKTPGRKKVGSKEKKKQKIPKKKKRTRALGGVHVFGPPKAKSKRFEVGQCINAKYSDGKSYGAFISHVHPKEDKYQVYFIDDGIVMDVEPKDITLPLTSGKSTQNADKYIGKMFYEEGGWDKKNNRHYEKGEFMVERITDNNNFVCVRAGTGEDEAEDVEQFEMCYCIPKIRKYEEE